MAVSANPITLNGSHGEGGSFLLRTALSMAALTQQPLRINNIRGATRKPGLTSEDLTFVTALLRCCSAECDGDELESSALSFTPQHAPRPLNNSFDIQEHEKGNIPGNALIVLHALLPVLARAGAYSRVSVRGETYNPNTLTYDAFERVTLDLHRKQGLYAYPTLVQAGFGYGGRGEVSMDVEPSLLNGFQWSARGELQEMSVVIATAEVPPDIAERGAEQARKLFAEMGIAVDVECIEVPSKSAGVFITMFAHFENGMGSAGAMGARGLRMEVVVKRCFHDFMEWYQSDATIDPFLADQVLLPAAVAEGETVFTTNLVTQRLQTTTWVIKQFLPIHITLHGQVGEPGKVVVNRS